MLANIVAGDTTSITYENGDYSATVYSIWIALRGATVDPIDINDSNTNISITGSGNKWTITVPKAVTETYTAGEYKYSIYLYTSTLRYEVETGTVKVISDLASQTAQNDTRSHVKKVLDAIEAVIEGRASTDQMSYTIAGRSLSKMPVKDLLYLRDRYKAEYKRELDAEKIAMGASIGGQVRVKL
jgi:hypothetical protein